MWLSFFSMAVVNGFINNYQKSFGQNYIENDRFFAVIGTVSSILNGSSRMLWGYIYDKLGFKVCTC